MTLGIYEEVNLMNHNCQPNVICVFNESGDINVVAIRDI